MASELVPVGYDLLLGEIKERVRVAQIRAMVVVNSEAILLNWSIGHDILQKQERAARRRPFQDSDSISL